MGKYYGTSPCKRHCYFLVGERSTGDTCIVESTCTQAINIAGLEILFRLCDDAKSFSLTNV